MSLSRALLLLVLAAGAAPAAILGALLARERGGLDGPTAATLAALLGLVAALAAWGARRVARPVAECVQGALEIARGRFGRQLRAAGRNELGDLAHAFNHMSRELAGYDAENRRLIGALERGYLDTIRSLASAIDAKDPSTHGHSRRVAGLAVEIGRELGLSPQALRALEYAGVLHDIGKIGIPDPVLGKTTPLAAPEVDLIRAHPLIGAEIVAGVDFLRDALPAIRHHHERWDGGGYPDGLAAEAIPLIARIVNAADTWDACTSDRPYQRALSPGEARAVLTGLRGTQLDPAVHDALEAVLARRGAADATKPTEAP